MSIYVITNSEIHDPAAYEKYKAAAPQYVARHGGEYCVCVAVRSRFWWAIGGPPAFGFEISHARGLCEFHGRPGLPTLERAEGIDFDADQRRYRGWLRRLSELAEALA